MNNQAHINAELWVNNDSLWVDKNAACLFPLLSQPGSISQYSVVSSAMCAAGMRLKERGRKKESDAHKESFAPCSMEVSVFWSMLNVFGVA